MMTNLCDQHSERFVTFQINSHSIILVVKSKFSLARKQKREFARCTMLSVKTTMPASVLHVIRAQSRKTKSILSYTHTHTRSYIVYIHTRQYTYKIERWCKRVCRIWGSKKPARSFNVATPSHQHVQKLTILPVYAWQSQSVEYQLKLRNCDLPATCIILQLQRFQR